MKLKFSAALLAFAFAATPLRAEAPETPPKLIVAISVDQFSSDLFAQYRQHFTGGLARLARGVVFPAGYQGHAATETCPGHSTILTGSRPARTGIVANNWFDLGVGREDKSIYCSEDERIEGSSSQSYTVSPWHLRVPALGDHMIRANPQSRSVAVAGKDRAAIMMGGHALRRHWVAFFVRDGGYYVFADSKRPGVLAGPYAGPAQFIAEYAAYRKRQIVAFRELASYERKLAAKRSREARSP